jgi:molecular chaperone HtpG
MNTDLIAEHGTVQEPSERFDMRANFEGLIQLLARNLYPEPDVFVRELIQNAHDGIRLRQELEPVHAGRIDVELRPGDREIVFRDDGLGMDRDDIKQFLSVIGSTGTGTARARLEEANHATAVSLIGQFGIGMLSAFVVAERVTVRTRKRGSAESFVWQNEGRTECRLSRGPEMDVGTEIVVSVARAHAYMLQSTRIREAIVRYCDFLPLPVHLNGRGPVNLVHAPWDRNGWPSEDVRDTAYRDFVSHRYPDVPLEVIPVEIEEPVHARGALYITDRRIPDMDTAGVVDIFVRRMFVRGGDAELLPPWAKFVRGLIECPDLQPTAARDNVRRDGWAYEALRQRLAELIVERLGYLAAHRPDRFREINRWHHYHLKGMALFHEDFFAQVAALLLFDTNRGLLSLGELFANGSGAAGESGESWRPQEGEGAQGAQPSVFYFSKPGAAPQFYRLADARGWTVINAGLLFEKELLEKYAQATGSVRRLVALDTSEDRALFEAAWSDEGACARVERGIEDSLAELGLDQVAVQVCRYLPESLPAVVLLSPDSTADLRLQAIVRQPWFLESLGDVTREVLRQHGHRTIRLRLNELHPLIRELLADPLRTRDRELAAGLFLSAALNAKDLLIDDTVDVLHAELLSLLGRRAEVHQ